MSALFEYGFVVRVPSWHRGEQTIFAEYPGREEAYIAAGHDYEVVECNSGAEGGIIADPQAYTGPMVRINGEWRAYRRNPNEKMLRIKGLREGHPLHGRDIKTVNKSYTPVQNSVPWDILDDILSDPDINQSLKLNYETGGVLENGASCYVTAYMDFPFQIPGDDSKVYPYVFGTWRHDGQGSINVGGSSMRIVCANTRGAAEGEAGETGRMFTFRHTKNVHARLADAKMALKGILVEHSEFHELAKELAAIPVTVEQRQTFVERFIPYPDTLLVAEGDASVRQKNNIDRARAAVMATFNTRSIPEAHELTGWGLYNAATEYLDHLRPTTGGMDIDGAIEGEDAEKAKRAIQSYIKRTITPNRAKSAVVPLIKDVCAIA